MRYSRGYIQICLEIPLEFLQSVGEGGFPPRILIIARVTCNSRIDKCISTNCRLYQMQYLSRGDT